MQASGIVISVSFRDRPIEDFWIALDHQITKRNQDLCRLRIGEKQLELLIAGEEGKGEHQSELRGEKQLTVRVAFANCMLSKSICGPKVSARGGRIQR